MPESELSQTDFSAPPPEAFQFGRNWQRYVNDHLDADRVEIAAQSLADLIPVDLSGKDFLDIGCGSGLFSYCAHRGGANVTSIDVDPDSVEAAGRLRLRAGSPDSWTITQGSILDPTLPQRVARADIVYSWGVLHHTGDMWTAIEAASRFVRPGGYFVIAIYNRVTGPFLSSERWARIKQAYVTGPRAKKMAMEGIYTSYWAASCLKRRRSPLAVAREYKASRGMAVRTDLLDWLGGYPYEYATVEEITAFCEESAGLTLVRSLPIDPSGTGNNEFVFRAPESV